MQKQKERRKNVHSSTKMGYTIPMLEFEILARGLYRPDQLTITYNPSLRMPTSLAIQHWIDTLWTQKLANAQEKHIPLFDAPLYRFITAASQPGGTLHLVLGYTC